MTDLTLIIPEKSDIERDAVAEAWQSFNGEVIRLGRFWEPPEINPARVRLYGNDAFCLVLEQKYGLSLVSPPDDIIRDIDPEWLKREISITSLSDVIEDTYPCFIKPVVPKQFTAAIYKSPDELEKECRGLDSETEVIKSSIVDIQAEARSFICKGQVLDCSIYEGEGDLSEAIEFIKSFANNVNLPDTCVIDVGLTKKGWVFIEANASWGAGLNGCDPVKILPAIVEATKY